MKQPGYRPGYCKKMLEYFAQPPQRVEKKVAYYPDGGVKSEEPVLLPGAAADFSGFCREHRRAGVGAHAVAKRAPGL